MIWTNHSFFKMMIYDLERPPEFPPCQQIKVNFNDHQDIHYVSTLINLETYVQSLRGLTNFRKNQFMEFIPLLGVLSGCPLHVNGVPLDCNGLPIYLILFPMPSSDYLCVLLDFLLIVYGFIWITLEFQ